MKLTHAILLAVLLPAPLAAQTREWTSYRDSLRALSDVPALQRLQSRLPMPGMATTPEPLIERGLIRLRIAEVTHDATDAQLAREAFERGADRFPRVTWMHYGLALAYAGEAAARLNQENGITVTHSFAEILGKDPKSRARKAAQDALELDSLFAPAAVLLARLAVDDGRDHGDIVAARQALLGLRRNGQATPEVNSALAEVETALGDYHQAEAALDEGGSAPTLVARAQALLLQPGRDDAGAAAYFAAVDTLDAASAERLFQDVGVIATAAEVADWEHADLSGRRFWLHRFWERRAADSGVTPAERLAEHYRRLALARRDYLRNSRRGVNGSGVLLAETATGGSPFDDRGVVLLKRGLPERVVSTRSDGLLPNETWIYRAPDGTSNQLFHFVALRGSRDYSLVSDLLQALDGAVDPIEDKARFDRAVISLIEDRAAFEPRYQAAVARLRADLLTFNTGSRVIDQTEIRRMVHTEVESVDAEYRRQARQALASDVYVARYDRELPFHFDVFTFRAPFGRTDLTAAFAIPAEGAAALEEQGRRVYPVALSIILQDTLTDDVTRRDTLVRIATAQPLHAGDFLRAHVTLPVLPSDNTVYRVVARSPVVDAGSVFTGTTRLKDYTGAGLQVSDLVLASPDSAGDWERGDLKLAVTLPRRFQPGHPFTLFYEIYNLAADAPYRTHLTVDPVQGGGALGSVKRLFGGGPPHIDLRFEDRARPDVTGALQELRRLGTDLPPGRYRMRITVTGVQTGERAESETVFEVVG